MLVVHLAVALQQVISPAQACAVHTWLHLTQCLLCCESHRAEERRKPAAPCLCSQDDAGAAAAAEAILAHMEYALAHRLGDAPGRPEQLTVVLDSHGAPTLQVRPRGRRRALGSERWWLSDGEWRRNGCCCRLPARMSLRSLSVELASLLSMQHAPAVLCAYPVTASFSGELTIGHSTDDLPCSCTAAC